MFSPGSNLSISMLQLFADETNEVPPPTLNHSLFSEMIYELPLNFPLMPYIQHFNAFWFFQYSFSFFKQI